LGLNTILTTDSCADLISNGTSKKQEITMKYKNPWFSEYLNKEELMKLSDKKLEKIGKTYGLDLDRRKKKSTLVDELYLQFKSLGEVL
tara:strand:- start:711 stop:974 length:264 start_codon:yes stop_codon:yes gene_type:complete